MTNIHIHLRCCHGDCRQWNNASDLTFFRRIAEGNLKHINTLRLRQNGRHFADDTFNRIFLNENVWISIKISLKNVPKGPINNIPALVQIMAWRRPGDKPLSEPMMISLMTHICVTRPQWVKHGWSQNAVFLIFLPLFCSVCYDFSEDTWSLLYTSGGGLRSQKASCWVMNQLLLRAVQDHFIEVRIHREDEKAWFDLFSINQYEINLHW